MASQEKTKQRGRPTLTTAALSAKKAEIASIALNLFLDEGFDAVSMRRLGKEVGMTPMALYRYFPSKLDILANLWGHIIGLAFNEVALSARQNETPVQALRRMCTAYVGYWQDNTDHYHLVFMSSGVTSSAVKSFLEQSDIVAKFGVFFSSVAELRSQDPACDQVKQKTDGLICCLHGIMHSTITMQGYPWTNPEVLINDAVEGVTR